MLVWNIWQIACLIFVAVEYSSQNCDNICDDEIYGDNGDGDNDEDDGDDDDDIGPEIVGMWAKAVPRWWYQLPLTLLCTLLYLWISYKKMGQS